MLLLPLRTPPFRRSAAMWVALVASACDRPRQLGDPPDVSPFVAERPALVVEVTEVDGAPIAGAWVSLVPGPRDAQTDDEGLAHFHDLGAGDFAASVTAGGFAPAAVDATVVGEDVTVTVALAPEDPAVTTLSGLVLDGAGAPAPGVEVVVDDVVVASTDVTGGWIYTPGSGTAHHVELRPPASANLAPADLGTVTVEEGGTAYLSWQLAPTPSATSRYIGASVCEICHADVAAKYEGSAHANAGRTPAEVEGDATLDDLFAAFDSGAVVSLSPKVPGATLTLDVVGDTWTVTVRDVFGATAGPLDVVEVYGGRRSGAALSVDAGFEALIPAAWAMPGTGASADQAVAAFVAAWTEGWFDASGHLVYPPEGANDYASQCGGCHVTGAALDGDLVPADLAALTFERRVGCEACHDRGLDHSQAIDARTTTILQPARLHPSARVEVCARCHERRGPTAHPFDDDGQPLGPLADLPDGSPIRWLDVPASKVGWDQVGDFRTSPHQSGPLGYLGACEDCHDPHGSDFSAGLRYSPFDNQLCTTCHASTFPDEVAEAEHAHHQTFAPGPWSPGACTGCHFPRTGVEVRPDKVSGAGELHSHAITFALPEQSLAEFDAAGVDLLPLGSVPLPACLDCHLQADALAEDSGENCACAVGSPLVRDTYEDFQAVFDIVWGAP